MIADLLLISALLVGLPAGLVVTMRMLGATRDEEDS